MIKFKNSGGMITFVRGRYIGATTLSIMTHSITTLSIMTHSITTLSIMTHSITTLSIKGLFATLSITTLSIITFSITSLSHYAQCLMLSLVMLRVMVLNVVVPNVMVQKYQTHTTSNIVRDDGFDNEIKTAHILNTISML